MPLCPGSIRIGSAEDCDLRLSGYGVSGTHAEVRLDSSGVRILDLGSANGTWVNGSRVTDALLEPGDRILLGTVMVYLADAVSDRVLVLASGPARPQRSIPTGEQIGERVFRLLTGEREQGEENVLGLASELMAVSRDQGDGQGPDIEGSLERVRKAVGADGIRLWAFEPVLGRWSVRTRCGDLSIPLDEASEALLQGDGDEVRVRDIEGFPGTVMVVSELTRAPRALCLSFECAPDRVGMLRGSLRTHRPVLQALGIVLENESHRAEAERTRQALSQGASFPGFGDQPADCGALLGHSEVMCRLRARVAEAVDASGPVTLICGETGTGADQVSRFIHGRGIRAAGPHLVVRCGELAENELAAQLAGDRQDGWAGLARGGTLFFDEVADLSAADQILLARWIEEGRRDPHLVLASRRKPELLQERGFVTPVLLERIVERPIVLPPLRERPEDIVPLAWHFVRAFGYGAHKHFRGLSSELCDSLRQHAWPGNIAELRSMMHQAVLHAVDSILDRDATPLARAREERHSPMDQLVHALSCRWREAKSMFQLMYFERLMRKHNDNYTSAAVDAGIARKNLVQKVKKFGEGTRRT